MMVWREWRIAELVSGVIIPGVFEELKMTTPGDCVAGKSVATFPVKLTLSKRR